MTTLGFITVKVYPSEDGSVLDCSVCGALGAAVEGEVIEAVRDHLEEHGCDLTQVRVTGEDKT